MLLRNLIYIFTSGVSKAGYTYVTIRGGGKVNVQYLSPSSVLKYSVYATGLSSSATIGTTVGLSAFCIAVGTGTTPANYLDSEIEAGFVPIETGTANMTNGKIIISAAYTPTQDKTITEIGTFVGNGSSNKYGIMLTRTVFDAPVTIKANTTKTFSITIDCNKFSEGYTIN